MKYIKQIFCGFLLFAGATPLDAMKKTYPPFVNFGDQEAKIKQYAINDAKNFFTNECEKLITPTGVNQAIIVINNKIRELDTAAKAFDKKMALNANQQMRFFSEQDLRSNSVYLFEFVQELNRQLDTMGNQQMVAQIKKATIETQANLMRIHDIAQDEPTKDTAPMRNAEDDGTGSW